MHLNGLFTHMREVSVHMHEVSVHMHEPPMHMHGRLVQLKNPCAHMRGNRAPVPIRQDTRGVFVAILEKENFDYLLNFKRQRLALKCGQ